ncbi:zinc metalloprotease HtpX [Acidithrix ferrooxidans]|nr:zinc metalloprotease HtpX [Acidithrix ferrooxidans]
MAKSKFPKDRGLTARMGLTVFLLGLVYVIFIAVLLMLKLSLSLIAVVAFGILFVQYFFSDKIALASMKGKIVTREEEPQLHALVDRLCALANMPKPKVAVARNDMPNAFATGRNPSNSVVCATTGLMRRLNEQELEAVLAHELSHVAHRDVAVMTIASFLGMVAGFLTRIELWTGGGIGGGGNRRGNGNNNQGNAGMLILVVSVVVYAVSFLITRALSRYRELSADRSGAILIGRPSNLKSALIKITGEMGRIPTRDLRRASAFNSFYFAPAISPNSMSGLFSTHPSLEKRIAQLDKLERDLMQ